MSNFKKFTAPATWTYSNDEASKQSKKTPFIGSEGISPQEITFSRKIVQESRKRCVTKYLSSETAGNAIFITTCHCHHNKDGFQRTFSKKKNQKSLH